MRKERGRVRRSGEKGGRFPVPKKAWAPHHHTRLGVWAAPHGTGRGNASESLGLPPAAQRAEDRRLGPRAAAAARGREVQLLYP